MKTLTLISTLSSICANSIQVYAAGGEYSAPGSAQKAMYYEVERLISQIDQDALIQDARKEVFDARVPNEVRPEISANFDFTPVEGGEEIEFEVHTTVQKVGDVVNEQGKTSTLYVTVAVC